MMPATKITKKAILKEDENNNDILEFQVDPIIAINLSSNDQSEITNVFSIILGELVNAELEFTLEIDSQYPRGERGLQIDVCTKYVDQLNTEIAQAYIDFPDIFKK